MKSLNLLLLFATLFISRQSFCTDKDFKIVSGYISKHMISGVQYFLIEPDAHDATDEIPTLQTKEQLYPNASEHEKSTIYFWFDLLKKDAELPIVYRSHKNGSVSDIRLVGSIKRIIGDYGFINNPLQKEGSHFKMAAVNPRHRDKLRENDKVNFRFVGKDGRSWAVRVDAIQGQRM